MLLSVFDESQLRYTDKHREIYFGIYIYIVMIRPMKYSVSRCKFSDNL